jgi:hypothetical protein
MTIAPIKNRKMATPRLAFRIFPPHPDRYENAAQREEAGRKTCFLLS